MKMYFLLLATILFGLSSARADTVLTNTPAWDGSKSGTINDLGVFGWGDGSSISSPDLAFSADFASTPTPEPGTICLVFVGLGAMAARLRRR